MADTRHLQPSGRPEIEAALADVAQFPQMNPGPVLRMDADGVIVLVNPAARQAFSATDLIGDSWLARCPGMTPQLWHSVVHGDGDLLHEAEVEGSHYAFAHVRAPDRQTIFVFGSDITARKRAEAELAELARFPDMNPGPVLRVDLSGKVLLANRAAREVFGDAMAGCDWADLYPAAGPRWSEIVTAADVVNVEARLAERDYVFAHRMDAKTNLVFVYGFDVTDQRTAERALRQSERMATLGSLAAGVAHELNNPAAATTRAAAHLHSALAALEAARLKLGDVTADAQARQLLLDMDGEAREHALHHRSIDALVRSDLETELEDWLDDHGCDMTVDIAPALVDQHITADDLDHISSVIGDAAVPAVLEWVAAAFEVHRLTHEISESSKRISETVTALKAYSYLGQAAEAQLVDLHEDLDNTLVILRNKLKRGIEVRREYGDIPPVPAFGGELNHVWTNLLDNACDALDGSGTIVIRTSRANGWVVVEIIDDGPGIPADVLPRVFDAFFTTKEAGKGTGIGLHTAHAIVTDKHRGTITVDSRPGSTRFIVRLPLDRDSVGAEP